MWNWWSFLAGAVVGAVVLIVFSVVMVGGEK